MHTLDDIIPPSRRKDAETITGKSGSGLRQKSRFPFGTLVIAIVIVAASIGALFYFSSSRIEITPNTVSAAVQSSFVARKSGGALPFEVITSQKTASQNVAGSGTKTVNSAASGTITIYNAQSKAQKLITNTRFATASGLIFRIHAPVTIPAGTIDDPGSVKAKVYADQTGASYNIGPTSFTVPGFAGTPQASQVYARSTSSMTGGASGTVPVVDSSVEEKARTALIAALEPDLTSSIEAQIPTGYVLIPGAAAIVYEPLASASSETTGQVEVREQGTITAIVFPNSTVASAIATSVAGLGYQGEPVTLKSTEGLKLSSTSAPSVDLKSFAFALSGTASLVYTVDAARIAAAVAGETRSAAEVVLTNYPEVKRAIITLRPFWRQAFPQDPAAITVVVDGAN